jgi:hypothetical protein
MYYIIYKVSNQINGKFYIGSHKTINLNDNYMGSGKLLMYAQKKYGTENFIKEILHVFDTPEEMYAKEQEIVNIDFIAENNTYNVKIGGYGGWDHVNSHQLNLYGLNGRTSNVKNDLQRGRETQKYLKSNDVLYAKKIKKKVSDSLKMHYKDNPGTFEGKKHTKETKEKMSLAKKGKIKGSKNPQYGTMWITDGTKNKKIKAVDEIPESWYKGRVMCK